MKCQIVTIQSNNYGNRLQNYALQYSLEKMGITVYSNKILKNPCKDRIRILLRRLRKKNKNDYFEYFNKNIHFKYYKSVDEIKVDDYDFFIAGSDQIWNPNFKFNSEREFLTFAPTEKSIAYAASIGVNELNEEIAKKFTKNLKNFASISTREIEAANLVENLVNKKIPVVLDPTMLLTKEEWLNIVNLSHIKIDKPYIVKYMLGKRNKNIEKQIEEYAKLNGYYIVDIVQDDSLCIGPAEFLSLLYYSEFNFVDSFHGSVFSILFEKNFYAFNRPNEDGYGDMNTRFRTLFKETKLENRYIKNLDLCLDFSKRIDYATTDLLINNLRDESLQYLKKSIFK